MATVKVKVIRGVYIRGKACGEGMVLDIPGEDYGELFTAGCVVKYIEPPPKVEAPAAKASDTKASGK